MATKKTFSVSTLLKDVIGQDLVTSDFVAIFELVKNSIDAGAKNVAIEIDSDVIYVSDDGKGMSESDIQNKWLWLAYSAKADGSEDDKSSDDYRSRIINNGRYAGSKGIGRFSCDRLAKSLDLYTRQNPSQDWSHLKIDWTNFEVDRTKSDAARAAKVRFEDVEFELSNEKSIDVNPVHTTLPNCGTVIALSRLRSQWDEAKVDKLEKYLAKLVDPFELSKEISIEISSFGSPKAEIGNSIIDVLEGKTTWIRTVIEGVNVETWLTDRNVEVYHIREKFEFDMLSKAGVKIETVVYFLNTAAKRTFSIRMGMNPNQFGHVFLFLNGFRIFPIGEEKNDFWGMGHRKQQGSARFLGPRDVIGKVNISAPRLMFREASSRDAGLIEDEAVQQVRDAVEKYALRRLERYVNGISWKDKLDRFREDASGLDQPQTRARLIEVLSTLLGSKDVEVINFADHLFSLDLQLSDTQGMEKAIRDLSRIAEETGSEEVLQEVERARKTYARAERVRKEALAEAESAAEAREEAERRTVTAEARAEKAERLSELVGDQARQLAASAQVNPATMEAFNHQASLYSSSIRQHALLAAEICREVRDSIANSADQKKEIGKLSEAITSMESIAFLGSRIGALTKVATRALFDLNEDWVEADIIRFVQDYISDVAVRNLSTGFASFNSGGIEWKCRFRPLDITIIVDNLIDNAAKAEAHSVQFLAFKPVGRDRPQVRISDDGNGIRSAKVDKTRLFEPGYTTRPMGTGLGLSQARAAMREMGGELALDDDRVGEEASFLLTLPPKKSKDGS